MKVLSPKRSKRSTQAGKFGTMGKSLTAHLVIILTSGAVALEANPLNKCKLELTK